MNRVMFFRQHDAASLGDGYQSRHGWHVRPLVQLVGHDHPGDETDITLPSGQIRVKIEGVQPAVLG